MPRADELEQLLAPDPVGGGDVAWHRASLHGPGPSGLVARVAGWPHGNTATCRTPGRARVRRSQPAGPARPARASPTRAVLGRPGRPARVVVPHRGAGRARRTASSDRFTAGGAGVGRPDRAHVRRAWRRCSRTSGRRCVLGHSMGGGLAAALAARRPDLVRAVVLEDPAWLDESPWGDEETVTRQRVDDARSVAADPQGAIAQCRAEHPTWPESELGPWAQAKADADEDVPALRRRGSWAPRGARSQPASGRPHWWSPATTR